MPDIKTVINAQIATLKPKSNPLPKIKKQIQEIQHLMKTQNLDARVVLGGSFGKGVWIEGESDVDIFVQFDKKYASDAISDLLGTALAPLHPTRVHGSRDYFQIHKTFLFEIVPVLDITTGTPAANVTDYSPLHTQWVNTHARLLRDDIRLAKVFVKAARVYGAESYKQGFSGHVLDILIVYYRGFLPFLENLVTWKKKTIIDCNNTHGKRALFYLNTSKTEGPLVVVDPLDSKRNAAAALRTHALVKLQRHAKAFLKNPDQSFFTVPKMPRKPGPNQVFVDVTPIPGKQDVVGAKLKRTFDHVKSSLAHQVHIKDADWFWEQDCARFVFTLNTTELPQTHAIRGPPTHMTEHARQFKSEHPSAQEHDNHLIATEPNPYATINELIAEALTLPKENKWILDK